MSNEYHELSFFSHREASKWEHVKAEDVNEVINTSVRVLFFAGDDERPSVILKYPDGAQYKIDIVASLRHNPLLLRTPPFDKLLVEAICRYTINLTHPIDKEANRCEKYLKAIFEGLISAVKTRQKEERKLYEASWLSPAATSFFKYISLLPQLQELKTSRSKSARGRILEELENILWETLGDEDDFAAELLHWLHNAYLEDGTIKLPRKLTPESIRNHLYSWMLCRDDDEGDEVPDPGTIRKRFYDAKKYMKQTGYQPEQVSGRHETGERMHPCDAEIVSRVEEKPIDVEAVRLKLEMLRLTALVVDIISPNDSIEESTLVYVRLLPSQQ